MQRLPEARAILRAVLLAPLAVVAHASAADEPAPGSAAATSAPTTAAPAFRAADAPLISQDELLARTGAQPAQTVVLDVRTPEEFAAGHLPGALNLPHDQIASRAGEIPALRDRDIVVYCRSGRRSLLALEALQARGFGKLWHLEGDYLAWEAAGRPVERAPPPEPAPAPEPAAAPASMP